MWRTGAKTAKQNVECRPKVCANVDAMANSHEIVAQRATNHPNVEQITSGYLQVQEIGIPTAKKNVHDKLPYQVKIQMGQMCMRQGAARPSTNAKLLKQS